MWVHGFLLLQKLFEIKKWLLNVLQEVEVACIYCNGNTCQPLAWLDHEDLITKFAPLYTRITLEASK